MVNNSPILDAATKLKEFQPTRVITVRLPRSLHGILKRAAHRHELSMNKLCLVRLLGEEASEIDEEVRRTTSPPFKSETAFAPVAPATPVVPEPELLRT